MLILDWMIRDVISVTPETSLLHCRRLFRDHTITTMPVLDGEGHVVGIVTNKDVQARLPRGSISRDIVDALDALEKIQVAELMRKDPVTIRYHSTVPRAARVMVDKHVHFLPVVNEDRKMVGLLTQWDVFQALATISGGGMPRGVEMVCEIENRRGSLREIIGQIRDTGVRIATVQSTLSEDGKTREVLICFWSDDEAEESRALESLRELPCVRYWNRGGEVYLRDQPDFAK